MKRLGINNVELAIVICCALITVVCTIGIVYIILTGKYIDFSFLWKAYYY